jgi:lipid-A-disaccharide synthase
MNLPEMLWAANFLGDEYEFVLPVAPTISKDLILEVMRSDVFTTAIHLTTDALPALAYSRAGIIASGTATVEAAMMGTPFVMVYRVSPLTYLLGRSRVKAPHFAMVNLIAGKEIVPELVQHDFTSEKVVARLTEILRDGPARERMIEGLAQVRTLLRGPNSEALHPAARAAEEIVALLRTPMRRS